MNGNMSFEASEILEGLQEAVSDAEGKAVTGIKKTIVYRVTVKMVCRCPLQDEVVQDI